MDDEIPDNDNDIVHFTQSADINSMDFAEPLSIKTLGCH